VLQEGVADGLRLLGLALQFELARFLRPLVLVDCAHACATACAGLQAQQRQQRVAGVCSTSVSVCTARVIATYSALT
jgi:hypothetical protein